MFSSISDLLTRACTITHREASGTRDDYGDEVATETTTSTVCELQQRSRDEDSDLGELTMQAWMLVLPAGTDVASGDTVTVEGQTFEVFGEPWTVRDPIVRSDSHIECTVKTTTAPDDASVTS